MLAHRKGIKDSEIARNWVEDKSFISLNIGVHISKDRKLHVNILRLKPDLPDIMKH